MKDFKKILFPTDLDENSAKILPLVLSTAGKWESEVYIMYVVDDPLKWDGMYEVPYPSLGNLRVEVMKNAERAMENACQEKLDGCPNFHRIVTSGNAASEILKTIEDEEIDMVIMGSDSGNWFSRALFGGVTGNVTKKSSVPVMVVNPNKLN